MSLSSSLNDNMARSSSDKSNSSDDSLRRKTARGATAASARTLLVQPSTLSNTGGGSSIRSKRRNRLKNKAGNSQQKIIVSSDGKKTISVATVVTRENGYSYATSDADGKVGEAYFPTSGNLPDPWHGAISMDHLRQHAYFRPLPLAPPTTRLERSLEEARQFRQDSWQWNVLHQGRCTTSLAAAALGFLEPTTGQVLGIPPSWRRGAHQAFVRLRQPPVVRTLDEMNALLLNPPPHDVMMDDMSYSDAGSISAQQESVWQHRSSSSTSRSNNNTTCSPTTALANEEEEEEEEQPMFVSDYIHRPSVQEMQRRKAYMRERSSPEYLAKSIRLYWGNTQEATAMLTALNYFSKNCTGKTTVTLAEVGMCGAGLDLNQSSSSSFSSSLLIGATPDGVLCYSDGRIEALEVKNHCPFFSNVGRKRRGGKVKGAFSIGDRPMDQTGILAQYVSQLQLEMLCLGTNCQSAVMVRQTATQGAYIIRMHRDDDWIREMLYFLHLFQRDYVEPNIKPPVDFFWNEQEDRDIAVTKRYRRFVNRTAQLKGHIVAYIPHNEIQRVNGSFPFFLDHL
jgi:hypothetical protein